MNGNNSKFVESCPIFLDAGIDQVLWHLLRNGIRSTLFRNLNEFSQNANLCLTVSLNVEIELLSNSEMIIIIVKSFLSNSNFFGSFIKSVQSSSCLVICCIVVGSPKLYCSDSLLYCSLFHLLCFRSIVFITLLYRLIYHLASRWRVCHEVNLNRVVNDWLDRNFNLSA